MCGRHRWTTVYAQQWNRCINARWHHIIGNKLRHWISQYLYPNRVFHRMDRKFCVSQLIGRSSLFPCELINFSSAFYGIPSNSRDVNITFKVVDNNKIINGKEKQIENFLYSIEFDSVEHFRYLIDLVFISSYRHTNSSNKSIQVNGKNNIKWWEPT